MHHYCRLYLSLEDVAHHLLPQTIVDVILIYELQSNSIGPTEPSLHGIFPAATILTRINGVVLLEHLVVLVVSSNVGVYPTLGEGLGKVHGVWVPTLLKTENDELL